MEQEIWCRKISGDLLNSKCDYTGSHHPCSCWDQFSLCSWLSWSSFYPEGFPLHNFGLNQVDIAVCMNSNAVIGDTTYLCSFNLVSRVLTVSPIYVSPHSQGNSCTMPLTCSIRDLSLTLLRRLLRVHLAEKMVLIPICQHCRCTCMHSLTQEYPKA